MANNEIVLGVIGGSGVYDIDGLTDREWRRFDTPWGDPSDELLFGKLGGLQMVFLPRHGRGHRLSPSGINYRANIDALKQAGCTDVISVSAVGSFKDELAPGTFVLVDQYFDRTFAREKSFFGNGCVAHVGFGHPVAASLVDALAEACEKAGVSYQKGGKLLVMEGPQFSTLAESELYKAQGFDVIGMTAMPEAKLAREAELCYATVAMVTDFDCWHPDHDSVTVDQVVAVAHANAKNARKVIEEAVTVLTRGDYVRDESCVTALTHAIMTAPDAIDTAMKAKLATIAGRVLK